MDCFNKSCVDHFINCVNHHADYRSVVHWMNDPNRKPAVLAFTEGPERQVAYAFEKWTVNVEKGRG